MMIALSSLKAIVYSDKINAFKLTVSKNVAILRRN